MLNQKRFFRVKGWSGACSSLVVFEDLAAVFSSDRCNIHCFLSFLDFFCSSGFGIKQAGGTLHHLSIIDFLEKPSNQKKKIQIFMISQVVYMACLMLGRTTIWCRRDTITTKRMASFGKKVVIIYKIC